MSNIIQGEVIRIKERRPPEEQAKLLVELQLYLLDQAKVIAVEVLETKEKANENEKG